MSLSLSENFMWLNRYFPKKI